MAQPKRVREKNIAVNPKSIKDGFKLNEKLFLLVF